MSIRDKRERAWVGALSNPALSKLMARLADARLPEPMLRKLLRWYVRAYHVDMSEAREPLESFPTFNDFFIRALKDGARPAATGPVVVSPCDSLVSSIGTLADDALLTQVKGRTYTVAALLGSDEDAARFRGAVHATLYLSPAMYHRVHSPLDGEVRSWRYVPGRLYPVNKLAVRHVESLFAVNERISVILEGPLGLAAVVLVGATNVGRISLAFSELRSNVGTKGGAFVPEQPVTLARGAELGRFNLGSTVVLLVANPRLQPLVAADSLVRMGQALWQQR